MRVVVYQEKYCSRERERVSYNFINSYEFIQHAYPSNTNTCVSCNSKKKKKIQNMGREILWKHH